jgi:hypothetical protein
LDCVKIVVSSAPKRVRKATACDCRTTISP